jgi:hypothetical protein
VCGAERIRSAPGSSDLNFLGDLKGIVDFDAKIPHGAFNLWPAGHRTESDPGGLSQARGALITSAMVRGRQPELYQCAGKPEGNGLI